MIVVSRTKVGFLHGDVKRKQIAPRLVAPQVISNKSSTSASTRNKLVVPSLFKSKTMQFKVVSAKMTIIITPIPPL